MRVNVQMRGAKCKNAPFHRRNAPFHRKNGLSGAKTGKVSDWYQSDNYL